MPRQGRRTPGGLVYHVLNRAVGRMRLFESRQDYAAFEEIIRETLKDFPMRICAFCIMPNHWHFVLWPEGDEDVSRFMQRLTVTHAMRWLKNRRSIGTGHVYQGRSSHFLSKRTSIFTT